MIFVGRFDDDLNLLIIGQPAGVGPRDDAYGMQVR
jgi:hypothetical protein